MKSTVAERRGRGRPSKFGRPSQLVALTLPVDVVRGLRRLDRDLARAVVRVFEGTPNSADEPSEDLQPDAELLKIADRRSLIVVNSMVIRSLPGVALVPLDGTRAFLALDAGRGVSDLELAVIDRLDDAVQARERQALEQLRRQLRTWRRDPALRFHGRAIIVVETLPASRAKGDRTTARAGARKQVGQRRGSAVDSMPRGPLPADPEERKPRPLRTRPSVH